METTQFICISIAVIFAIFLALGAWKVLNMVWFQPKKLEKKLREQGLKGNKYRLLFGDVKDMISAFEEAHSKPIGVLDDIVPRIVPHFHQTFNKFGKNSFFWLGPYPLVFITDPDSIREVMVKFNIFQKPNFLPVVKLLAQGLVTLEGDKWATHRKIINPAFHVDKLKVMLPAFYICAIEMLDQWVELASAKGSCELDVWPYIQTLSADSLSKTAFGSSCEEGRKISELQTEQGELVLLTARSLFIPGLRFVPTRKNRRMKEIYRIVNNIIRSIIDARIAAERAGGTFGNGGTFVNDLLGTLLESNAKEIDMAGNKKFGLTIEDVIDECKLFYLAGQETTSGLLVWTMVLLSTHPHWQSRAREEVFELFGNNKPDFEGLNRLKIVNMILYEVLRLYPPFGVINRVTAEETKLGDLSLPAGVLLALPAILVHHDPAIWGSDVKEFKPERFAEGVSNATKGQVTFMPFGWGPRICIGQNFAMLESKMALVMILQRFSFELSPSYAHAPRAIATLQPQHGAHLILHRL